MALDTPSPCSAKVDAHWLTTCSLAPAHIIISMMIQNRREENSSRILRPVSPSAISGASGTRRKAMPFTSGRIAHSAARIGQRSRPKASMNSVESSMTPALPQQ